MRHSVMNSMNLIFKFLALRLKKVSFDQVVHLKNKIVS